jgi:hypothetical protein
MVQLVGNTLVCSGSHSSTLKLEGARSIEAVIYLQDYTVSEPRRLQCEHPLHWKPEELHCCWLYCLNQHVDSVGYVVCTPTDESDFVIMPFANKLEVECSLIQIVVVRVMCRLMCWNFVLEWGVSCKSSDNISWILLHGIWSKTWIWYMTINVRHLLIKICCTFHMRLFFFTTLSHRS